MENIAHFAIRIPRSLEVDLATRAKRIGLGKSTYARAVLAAFCSGGLIPAPGPTVLALRRSRKEERSVKA
jgi:hypothetical protein